MEFLCDFTIEILLSFRLVQSAVTKSCILRKRTFHICILLMMIKVDSTKERCILHQSVLTLVYRIDVQVEINVQGEKFLKNIKCAGQIRRAGGKFSGKSINVQGEKLCSFASVLGYLTCPKKALILYLNGSTIASEFFLSFLPAFLSTQDCHFIKIQLTQMNVQGGIFSQN